MVKGVIYRIINNINGKYYLGSTKNFNKRKNAHLLSLKKNIHHSTYLQRAWNKYGEENFKFEILYEINDGDVLEVEQKYLNELDFNMCYNVSKFAGGGDNISYHPDKEKFISKMIKTMKDLRDSGLIKIPDMSGDKNPNWRGGTSKSYCNCGNEKALNAKTCHECRNRSGDKNPYYGKHHSEETKQILSEKRKGKYLGNQERKIIIDGIEYKSLGSASKELGIHITTINYRLKSKTQQFSNYQYL